MNSNIKVGVAGTGHWGKNLLRNFNALGALAGFCDASESSLAPFKELYPDAAAYTRFEDLLENDAIDAVVIATPAEMHGAMVRQALEKGKHVFVEKPLCLDVQEGYALKRLSEEKGLTLMVGHLLLYHPAFKALCAVIDKGSLGDLRYIISNRLSLGKIRREENALWSFAPHDISMILKLAGRLPQRVVANGGAYLAPPVADTTLSHMSFEGGLQAHIFVSWLHPFKDQKLIVVGSKAMAVFDDVKGGDEKLLYFPHEVHWEDSIPTVNKAQGEPIPYDEGEPLKNECQHFLDSVRESTQPTSNAEEALGVLSVLDACQRSLTSGMPIDFE